MEKCLVDNKICSEQNKKCKECIFDDCKKTLKLLEEMDKMYEDIKSENLRKEMKEQYPQCLNCRFLQVISLDNKKVYCSYMINNKCIFEGGKPC